MQIDFERAQAILPSVVFVCGHCRNAGSHFFVQMHRDHESLHRDYPTSFVSDRSTNVREDPMFPAYGVAPTIEEAFEYALLDLEHKAPFWKVLT